MVTDQEAKQIEDFFNDDNQVKGNYISWGKVGDYVKGTLVEVREKDCRLPNHEGERQKEYEIKVEVGQFHNIDENKMPVEPSVVIERGQFYRFSGKASFKSALDDSMRKIKIGQIVGIRFSDEVPSKTKGYAKAKILKVYAGEMDPTYMGETSGDVEVPPM